MKIAQRMWMPMRLRMLHLGHPGHPDQGECLINDKPREDDDVDALEWGKFSKYS